MAGGDRRGARHHAAALTQATGATCMMALSSFFQGMMLENSESKPPEGLFAQMCDAFQKAGLSAAQTQVCACDLVIAGYLTTTFILATGVRNLLLHPEQMQKLREDPALVHTALEEMLRFDGQCSCSIGAPRPTPKSGDTGSSRGQDLDGDWLGRPRPGLLLTARSLRYLARRGNAFRIRRRRSPVHRRAVGAQGRAVGLEMLLAEFPDLAADGSAAVADGSVSSRAYKSAGAFLRMLTPRRLQPRLPGTAAR